MEDAALAFEHYSCAACTDHYRNTHFALPAGCASQRNGICARIARYRSTGGLPGRYLCRYRAWRRLSLAGVSILYGSIRIGFKTRRPGRLERFGNDSALELG